MKRTAGSALLLTVMVIAVLTTTTLGAVAIRFEQLASTDKINNSAVAKLAADSGLAKLKEKLAASTNVTPTIYDLDKDQETTSGVDLTSYKPSPRSIVSSFEKASTGLPRCLAVAVVVPWVNGGKYLFQEDDSSNPALIFHYANIINDTPIGAIPENDSIDKDNQNLPVSELTRMGHFYNPYAPTTEQQGSRSYWTIKMGGPEDEFLTKKGSDGVSSYYNGLDFVYIPYLPRFTDTSLITSGGSQTGLDRIAGDAYRQKLETVITSNNFKVWLDSSVKDGVINEYGLGDLFIDSNEYRVSWLQPSLWNDLPEADLAMVRKTEDVNNTIASPWTKKSQSLLTTGNGTSGWDVDIARGARSSGMWRMNANAGATQLSPGATISALYYGPLDGIRLNQKISVTLVRKGDRNPLALQQRTTDQGRLYDVKITEVSVAGNAVTMRLLLSNGSYQTPLKADGSPIRWADLDSIVAGGTSQVSTTNVLSGASISDPGADGVNVAVNVSSSCVIAGNLAACPAVGDIVTLTRAGSPKTWGQVSSVRFTGASITGFTVDTLRALPKPLRHQASTAFTDGSGNPLIAYYGGEIVANDYDGGFNNESDELWIYNPEADTWSYPSQTGTAPGRLAGSSLVYDSLNGRLILFGGYYHEPIALTNPPGQINCQLTPSTCLSSNQAGLRVAKRISNDTFAYTIATGTWEKITYTLNPTKKIQNGKSYQVRVVSTLADRSGLERWKWTPRADTNGGAKVTLNVDGGTPTSVKVSPSAAGIAKGDELYVYSRQPSFSAWAKVTAVDFPSDTVTIQVRGNARTASTVVLDELLIQVLNRQNAAQSCTGAVNGAIYSCSLAGDTTGYAVGDQVVLEEFQSGRLEQSLTGYVSHMTAAGTLSFVADERRAEVADFRDNSGVGVGILADESAVALPVARYGAALQIKPGDPKSGRQINYLWQGNSKNIATNLRMPDIWELQFRSGVTSGEGSAVWGAKPKSQSNGTPSSSSDYNFKVIRTAHQAQIFTPSGGSLPAIEKTPTTDPRTGAQTLAWNNATTWDLTIDTSGAEALAASRLVAGASVVIERENGPDGPTPNARENFNGIIVSTFDGAYNSTIIRVKHNVSYPGDTGLRSHSKNAKISIFSSYRTDQAIYGKARWVPAGGYLRLSSLSADEIARVPSSGTAVMFWREANGKIEAFTMTLKNRTFEVGVREFRLYADGLPYQGPSPIAYGTNAVTSHNGDDAFTLALADHQLSTNGQGAPEWFADAKDNNPVWEVRISDTDNGSGQIDDRPAPRQAGSMATIFQNSSNKSQLFVIGGTFGRFADLWRMDDAGKMNGADDARWKIGRAASLQSQDVPNLFGGSLHVYEKNGVIKAVAFGGKLKFDSSSNDYGRSYGARIMGEPDVQSFAYPDNAYYLPANSVTTAGAMVATLANNFPSTVSNDVKAVQKSLALTGAGIPAGYTKTVCAYIAQVCDAANKSEPLLQHLGVLGRISANASTYGGGSWGVSRAVMNPGTAFRSEGTGVNEKPSLIGSLSAMSSARTNGRWDQDGYYPYRCDTGSGCDTAPYGATATNYTSDKTLMTAGFASITGANRGGALLVTASGVGMAIASNRGGSNDASGRWYSYCADVDATLKCKTDTARYLGWLPDVEDVVFLFNASLTLASTDTYRVIGYHGGAKRGYQVIKQPGRDPIVFEIVP